MRKWKPDRVRQKPVHLTHCDTVVGYPRVDTRDEGIRTASHCVVPRKHIIGFRQEE